VQACTYTLTAVCCAALLVWALASGEVGRAGPLARGLSHPILRTFGQYSYALYLLHSAMRPLLMRLFPADRLAQILRSPALALVAYTVLATLFCLALAWCSYHAVEKHFLRLKVYFSDHPGRSRRPATLLIRLAVGAVFFSEGIQKFLYPGALGVGRFAKIGIPAPALMAPFVGVVEVVGGALLLVGLLTRCASIALLVDIAVAIVTTKLPMLARAGFWATAHESRTDYAMLLSLVFLLLVGPGPLSLDARRGRAGRRSG
jgi:uncharacterized membrane protein YphA (DoxX/SURF4 family)